MKKTATTILLLLWFSIYSSAQSYEKWIDIQPSTLNNPPTKPGWVLKYSDEFDGSKNPATWSNEWCWGQPIPNNSPAYTRDANYAYSIKTIKLYNKEETYSPNGLYPKKYTTCQLISSDCIHDTIQHAGKTWTYGYFEARVRNPKSNYLWPAFWLFGEEDSKSVWNEIDIFEFGVNDALVTTSHYQGTQPNDQHVGTGKWIHSLPGQMFGNNWVTYALRWEPNKLIWYINNKPVHIETSLTGHIPKSSQYLIFTAGIQNFDWIEVVRNLPYTFPNYMEVDYVRVYQRADHNLPDPMFTINDQKSFSPSSPVLVPYFSNTRIKIDASESIMPDNNYFVSIQQCNSSGTLIGPEGMGWLSQSEVLNIHKFDLKAFAQSKNIVLAIGNTYRIKLAGGSPWTEMNQYMQLTACNSNMVFNSINGQAPVAWNTPITLNYNYGKSRIVLNASSCVSCTGAFVLKAQECNSTGAPFGTSYQVWFNPTSTQPVQGFYDSYELKNFDVDKAFQAIGLNMLYGHYYLLTLTNTVSGGTAEKKQMVYLNGCNSTIDFKINQITSSFPAPVTISNGDKIIVDGTASTICTYPTNYFLSVQECTSNGTTFGTEVSEWYPYFTIYEEAYHYSIGEIDIRAFCKSKNFTLGCNKYYRIKLATGSPWVENSKVIYIQSCPGTNSSCQINGVDLPEYFLDPPSQTQVYMYAPSSISCVREYFLAIQKYENGILTGPEAAAWLNSNQIREVTEYGAFDIKSFARDPNRDGNNSDGIDLLSGSTYRLNYIAAGGSCFIDGSIGSTKLLHFDQRTRAIFLPDSEKTALSLINIYPNPTANYLTVSIPNSILNTSYTIITMKGEIITSGMLSGDMSIIDLTQLAAAEYILRIQRGDEIINRKVIVFGN